MSRIRRKSRASHASKVTLQSVTPAAQVPLALGYGALPVNIVVKLQYK